MNSVNLIGRLTRDVEFKTTPTGINVCNFGVAVQRDFKNANGEYDADFFNVICWRGTADFANRYFKTGKMIAISGRLQSRAWTDQNGKKRTSVEIVADKIGFCGDGSKSAAQGNPAQPAAQNNQTPAAQPSAENPTAADFSVTDDDYPF